MRERECRILREEDIHTGFWQRNLKERDHLEELGADARILLKWKLNIFSYRNEQMHTCDNVQLCTFVYYTDTFL